MNVIKRVICCLMIGAMLINPEILRVAAAEGLQPEKEIEPILQMERVEGTESLEVPLMAEQQEKVDVQGNQEPGDTNLPELDVSSLHVEYDARLGGEATLTYRVTGESRITYCCASIIAVTNGGAKADGLNLGHLGVAATDVVAENTFTLAFYGTYQVQRIDVHDEYGYGVSYYNSKCLTYNGETPAVDMSVVDFVLPAPVDDTTVPVLDLSSIQLKKNVIEPNEENTLYVGVKDDSVIVDIKARFMRETGQEINCEVSELSKSDNGRYTLPIREDILGVWQLFSISATDACGNTTNFINSSHPKYSSIYGTENLYDLSDVTFEVKMDSFATPVIDFSSLSVDKKISRNKGVVIASFEVENSDSVKAIHLRYRVTTAMDQNSEVYTFYYNKNLNRFRGWCWPSYFGTYEVESIDVLDYSGEWQTIYNSALAYSWTLPEDAVFADLSALNFSSVDAQIYTMSDLKTALATAEQGDWLQIASSVDFVLDESATIPKGVYLNIQSGSGSFKIAEGATLTTASPFTCSVPMEVEGTFANTIEGCWVSLDNLLVAETGCVKVNGSTHVDKILVEGTLENGGTIWVNGDLLISAAGRVTNNGSITVCGTYANDGTVEQGENGSIHRYYTVSTVEDLIAMAATARKGDTIVLESGGKKFIIDRDVTIPEGVSLQAPEGLVVAKEVTLTTSEIHAPSVTVNGTWKNYGYSSLYQGLTIAGGGIVENNGYLQIADQYENHGKLINGSKGSARLSLRVEDEAELLDAFACDDPGQKEIDFYISGEMTITEDVQIPTNTDLNIFDSTGEGKATLTIDEGTILTNFGSFNCYVPMVVAGTLTNVGGMRMEKGLTITAAGTVDTTSGWFNLNGPLANNGTLVKGSNVNQTLEVHSVEELQSALAAVVPRGEVKLKSESEVVLSSDLAIPKGITVEVYESVQSLRIGTDAELTIDVSATLRSYVPIEVDGTVYNYGTISARRGMTVNGKIHNYDYIRVEGGALVGGENVVAYVTTSDCSVRKTYTVDSEESLHATLKDLDLSVWNSLTAPEGFALTKDVTIPSGVYLNVQSGTFVVEEAATLTTYNNLNVYGDMCVDGRWENNSSPLCGFSSAYVNGKLDVNGRVINGGHINLYQYTEALAQGKIQNSGKGTMDGYIEVSDMEELREIAESKNCLTMLVTWQGEESLILDCDLEIPKGMDFYARNTDIQILPGVTLSVDENAFICANNVSVATKSSLKNDGTCQFENVNVSGVLRSSSVFICHQLNVISNGRVEDAGVLRVDEVIVDGVWINNGETEVDALTVNGKVENSGSISANCVMGEKNISGNSVALNISPDDSSNVTLYVRTWNLQAVLNGAAKGTTVICEDYRDYYSDHSTIINESIIIPEGVTLEFSGVSKVYLTDGHTLTVNGTLLMQQQLYVAGDLVINGEVVLPSADEVDLGHVQYLGLTSGSISVIEGGSCALKGSIRVGKTDYTGQPIEDPRSLIAGVAMEDWSLRDVDDYWYVTKNPAVDKAEVFCSLPVAGCKLRLADESGNVRELMPSGGYALITDITYGAYTLEVSKPGYVTHTYKIDTTTLADVLDVELVQKGDVNGACVGGIDVEITDLACLYQYLTEGKNEGGIQDETYFKAVADVNDDGSIDVYDLQRLYEAVSRVNGF